jgi:hypothetical protein
LRVTAGECGYFNPEATFIRLVNYY